MTVLLPFDLLYTESCTKLDYVDLRSVKHDSHVDRSFIVMRRSMFAVSAGSSVREARGAQRTNQSSSPGKSTVGTTLARRHGLAPPNQLMSMYHVTYFSPMAVSPAISIACHVLLMKGVRAGQERWAAQQSWDGLDCRHIVDGLYVCCPRRPSSGC